MWENGLFRGGVFFLFAAHLCLLSVSILARSGNRQRLNYEELERGQEGDITLILSTQAISSQYHKS